MFLVTIIVLYLTTFHKKSSYNIFDIENVVLTVLLKNKILIPMIEKYLVFVFIVYFFSNICIYGYTIYF